MFEFTEEQLIDLLGIAFETGKIEELKRSCRFLSENSQKTIRRNRVQEIINDLKDGKYHS